MNGSNGVRKIGSWAHFPGEFAHSVSMLSVPALVLALSFLTGCSQRAETDARFRHFTYPAYLAEGDCAHMPLPEGLVIGTPYALREDTFYINKSGDIRRKVALHLLDGDLSSALANVVESMKHNKYKYIDQKRQKAGGSHTRMFKKGYGMVIIMTEPNSSRLELDLPPPSFHVTD